MQWKYLMNWWSLKSVLWLPMSKLWLSSVFRCVTSWMFYLQCVKFMALISFCKGVNENNSCLGAILCLNDLEFQHISLASISFSLSIPCEKFLFGSIFVSYLNSILPCFGAWRCMYENNNRWSNRKWNLNHGWIIEPQQLYFNFLDMQNFLQIASNSSLGDNLRIKALHFVSWLARIKPKVG